MYSINTLMHGQACFFQFASHVLLLRFIFTSFVPCLLTCLPTCLLTCVRTYFLFYLLDYLKSSTDGVMALVVDWYSLSLANVLFAWRRDTGITSTFARVRLFVAIVLLLLLFLFLLFISVVFMRGYIRALCNKGTYFF
jgi:hypothetical protein